MEFSKTIKNELNKFLQAHSDNSNFNNVAQIWGKGLLDIIDELPEISDEDLQAHLLFMSDILQRMSNNMPLTKLTDDEAEWDAISVVDSEICYRNNRWPYVYKLGNNVYDTTNKVRPKRNSELEGCKLDEFTEVTLPYIVEMDPNRFIISDNRFKFVVGESVLELLEEVFDLDFYYDYEFVPILHYINPINEQAKFVNLLSEIFQITNWSPNFTEETAYYEIIDKILECLPDDITIEIINENCERIIDRELDIKENDFDEEDEENCKEMKLDRLHCSKCGDAIYDSIGYKSLEDDSIICEECLLDDERLRTELITQYISEDGELLGDTTDYAELITSVCDELDYELYGGEML